MQHLRLTQHYDSPSHHRIQITLEGPPKREAMARFEFEMTANQQERLRWYLEEFLKDASDPAARKIAGRVERDMQTLGTQLFQSIFEANNNARRIWDRVADDLTNLYLEIETDVPGASRLPWELLFEPDAQAYLPLQVHSFVRTHAQAAREPLAAPQGDKIRILLVICRPRRRDDVPFRSVAMRIVKGLSDQARAAFQLDVLRPPTFERMAEVLRQASERGQPYHVVHFDGHGLFADISHVLKAQGEPDEELLKLLAELLDFDSGQFSNRVLYPRPIREGERGYLVFENPHHERNTRLVDGPELGQALVQAGVPVLVLNACRSAYADAAASSPPTGGEDADELPDVHTQVQAFGSLAQEIMDVGVGGVVAMRYNVYVATAAQFVANLYAALMRGQTLGRAVTLGRKQLADNPLRTIAYDPIPLQDWSVPIVYEAAPTPLFQEVGGAGAPLQIKLDTAETASRSTIDLPSPDTEFIGRDETLLALDRAFDRQAIVLLQAYAGSGKTATAAEFARWYRLTGGLEGPVLFTSFEQPRPLPQVLDTLGQVFEGALAQIGVNWLALSDEKRRAVALQVLAQVPLLWIWDNVEPVAGFPRPQDASLSPAQQAELADFLRAARGTKAKFLLTSRRDERGWLGGLPRRITLPSMPMQERAQLARALAEKYGHAFTQVVDWRPLLHFTQGNPLTIITLVGQALRAGLTSRAQIIEFVDDLEQGEAQISDEAAQGRAKSLAASLSYGFDHAFDQAERAQLALLHLFQGFVDVDVLHWMGDPEIGNLPQLHDVSRDDLVALLNRAADLGLLTPLGGRDSGYYTIHPALPWFFKTMFEGYYPEAPHPTSPQKGEAPDSPLPGGEGLGVRATRAFVAAMRALGNHYFWEYQGGNRDVIALLEREEANLGQARALALRYEWWDLVIGPMQGLRSLYGHTGRRAAWRRLVEEIVPDFVDPAGDGPRPGREEGWSLVMEYRVRLAREARDWAGAEQLQRLRVEWNRQRAAPFLADPPAEGRNTVRSLAASLHELGDIQREQGQADCIAHYEESLRLSEQIGEQAGAAICAFNLGRAYGGNVSDCRDLDQAERWYQRSLELTPKSDYQGRAQVLGQLGYVAYDQFQEARAANQPENVLLDHLNAALARYHQALDLLPADAVDDLAVAHNELGVIYKNTGDIDRALPHYRESIRYEEMQGNLYGAAQSRYNVALALAQAGRLADARDYAEAARRNYGAFGPAAAADVEDARRLLARIEEALAQSG